MSDLVPALPVNKQISLAPRNMSEAMQFAQLVSESDMVPKDYRGRPANVLVATQWGYEIGLSPLQSLQNIAVINGRPAVYGDAMLALVKGSGILESITETATATGATCTVKRKGEAEVVRTFSIDQAKKAGLWGKAGPWTQYPERMLQMRARGLALRDVFPDVLKGMYIAEEAQDIPAEVVEEVRSENPPFGQAESAPILASQKQWQRIRELRNHPTVNLDDTDFLNWVKDTYGGEYKCKTLTSIQAEEIIFDLCGLAGIKYELNEATF